MGESRELIVSGEAAMEAFARDLARALLPRLDRPVVVLLQGDLGTGKTTLVRGLLRGLGHHGRVPSPTYTLVEPYRLPGSGQVQHLDLYRLSDPQELEFLGWREWTAAPGLVLVEWPERAGGLLRQADLRITLAHAGASRAVSVQPLSSSGRRIVAEWDERAVPRPGTG